MTDDIFELLVIFSLILNFPNISTDWMDELTQERRKLCKNY